MRQIRDRGRRSFARERASPVLIPDQWAETRAV